MMDFSVWVEYNFLVDKSLLVLVSIALKSLPHSNLARPFRGRRAEVQTHRGFSLKLGIRKQQIGYGPLKAV